MTLHQHSILDFFAVSMPFKRMAWIAAAIAIFVPSIGAAATITLLANGQASASGVVVSGDTVYFASSIGGAAVSINSMSVNGGPVTTLYSGLTSPNSLTVIGSTIYWIDANSGPVTDTQILSAPIAGGGPVTAIYTGSNVGQPIVDGSGITTDGTTLYTADEVQGRVDSLNPNGSGLTQLGPNRYGGFFDTEHQNSIATANGILYVLDAGRSGVDSPQLVTIPVGGGPSFGTLWSGAPFNAPFAVTVGGGQIFIGDGSTIYTMPLTGGTPTVFFSGGPLTTVGLSALYYSNGSLFVGDLGSSAIYRIDSVPEPATISLMIGGLAIMAGCVRIRRRVVC